MQTGWQKVGKYTRYYDVNTGKMAIGKVKIGKDTWYLNSKTGNREGVDLGVKKIKQTGNNCGPCSLAMVMSYYKNKTFDQQAFADKYGTGNKAAAGFLKAAKEFGYTCSITTNCKSITEAKLKSELYKNNLIIMSVPDKSSTQGQWAAELGFTSGGGHFLVISGYNDGKFTLKDPAGRLTSATYATISKVVNSYSIFRKK